VLSHLPKHADPRLLVGIETADDAGVYRLTDDLALVQTVDLFPPVVDDAYWFGAIAAANALSDVYAMGGKPLTALNIAGWPRDLDMDLLGEVLRGAADKLHEAGTTLVGGHSWEDEEPKFGLSVTGLIHPQRIVTNAGAEVGDALVLTKPLGMGVITTGAKNELAEPEALEEAMRIMAGLNAGAAEAMLAVGVHAATDVTGFGLLGHLREMTRGSGAGADLRAAAIPVLPEARRLAALGMIPGGSQRNLEALRADVAFGALSEVDQQLLADAQTSGGLLIAVAPHKLAELLERLQTAGTPVHSHIGEITAPREPSIQVLATPQQG